MEYISIMKCHGKSYNTSEHKKRGIQTSFKCKYCNKEYKQLWSRDNHEKLCKEHNH